MFDSVTTWTAARQASLSFNVSQSLLRLMFIESVMLSHYLILCCPLLLLPSIFPSITFSALHIRWPKYWSLSFSTILSNEYSRLISFRIDWFDLTAVQETLKSLLHHHSSIFWHSGFIMIQLSHEYIALTIQTFVGKVIALLFNTLSLSQLLFQGANVLISRLQITIHSDFGTQENKVCHGFHCFPIYLP